MNHKHPTVAFTIGMTNTIDGPAYSVYTQAYGLEMMMDDEWEINTIIMAPPHLVSSMTQSADVVSMGAIPGASYTPGNGDYKQITDNDGRWVLARPDDDLSLIIEKKLGVLLVIENETDLDTLLPNKNLDATNFIIAFQIDSVSTPQNAQETAITINAKLADYSAMPQVLVSLSFGHESILDYASLPNISGLLLLDAEISDVIDLLTEMAE